MVWVRSASIPNLAKLQLDVTTTAAVDLAAKKTVRKLDLTPATMKNGVQRPAVLDPGGWLVAAAKEMVVAEEVSAMPQAAAVMMVTVAVAVAVRRSRRPP